MIIKPEVKQPATVDVIGVVRFDTVPYEAILTPTQYRYYSAYFRDGLKLADISIKYDVDITTVCRVLKSARARIIKYYEGR